MNRPRRLVGRALVGLALLSSLVGCGSTSPKPSSGHTPTSTYAVTSVAPVTRPAPTTTTTTSDLTPADAQMPASGVCGRVVGALVVITANPDTPSPRCVTVKGSQHLKVVNASNQLGQTGRTITVSFASFPPRQVPVGGTTTFDQNFGSYLAPGVHDLHITLYSGSAEIWLR